MKPLSYSLIAAALACGFASAQTTAVTTPVGYITHSIAGNALEFADTYISPSLIQTAAFAGASTLSPSGGKTITFSGGVPTTFDTSYVLEITSGPSEGWWSTVISSTGTTVVVNDNFPAGLPASVTVAVRKHATLGSFMGNNNPGLITYNGADPNDEVQILDASADPQSVKVYAYVSGPDLADPLYPNGAWFDLLNSVVANGAIIEPGSAIKIKRVGASALSFVSTGEVKITKTQVDIFTAFNWVGTPLATGGTLNGMTFHTQLNPYDGVDPNFDVLNFVRASQVVEPFAAADDGGLTMFDLTNSVPAGTEPFLTGTGVIINRIGKPSGVITLPGTVVAP